MVLSSKGGLRSGGSGRQQMVANATRMCVFATLVHPLSSLSLCRRSSKEDRASFVPGDRRALGGRGLDFIRTMAVTSWLRAVLRDRFRFEVTVGTQIRRKLRIAKD